MRGRWFARLFFTVVAAFAVAGVMAGTACTRWGQPGPTVPMVGQITGLFVDPSTGSDTSGNGSSPKPYKTLTKAVEVLTTAKNLSPKGVIITLANGDYNAANGEKFPIVIPTNVSLTGVSYGMGFKSGAFINGLGEDRNFENLVHAPRHSAYTTLEIAAASVTVSDVYVGASVLSLPGSHATYVALDNLATMIVSTSSFGAGITSALPNVGGVLVAGGSFTCHSCLIRGHEFGVGALTVPIATASPSAITPTVFLDHSNSDSVITAKEVGILTDGSVNVTAEEQTFQGGLFGFADALTPVVPVSIRGAVDFGGGAENSTGGNNFIGAKNTEIYVTRRNETVSALDNVWNPSEQRANRFGQYPRTIRFAAGAVGRNVTIRHSAVGSTVTVGPAPVPTPSPTGSPSTSPTATATST
ncbi:MAG: DUF1565 domain-containing protein [Candidatus Cybelea sp.]